MSMEMATAAPNGAEQDGGGAGDAPAAPTGAAANARPPAAVLLDPKLLMAARRGDIDRLKELLQLNGDGGDEQAAGTVEPTTVAVEAAQQVVVEVDPRPAAPMDPTVADAEEQVVAVDDAPAAPSSSGETSTRLQLLDGVTSNEGNSLLHVVAAAGDGGDFLRCARIIYRGKSGLLTSRNNKGDTPLHCAAAAGNADMVICLVALAFSGGETAAMELLRMRTECGETALHKAVRAASTDCIDNLMSVDPELVYVPREGDDGDTTSPLYLAVSLGKENIAEHLIHKSNCNLSCSGPEGSNVLHAAVTRAQGLISHQKYIPRGQALPKLLKCFEDLMVEVKEGDRCISVRLVSHLTNQRDNRTGSTPLHLAASLEGRPDAKILSGCYPNVWSRPELALTLLLDANESSAYQPDTQGLYPIHVAALFGSLDAVEILLQKHHDSATLRDGKGRTFLHVAVEEGRYAVVQYACCLMPQNFSSVLNVQDNNGDTALHRAIHVANLPIFMCLIQNQYVDLNIPNKDELTPLDLSWCRIPQFFCYHLNPQRLIHLTLQLVGASCGGIRPDLISEELIPEIDNDKVSGHLTNAAQVMGIVSVLVATVTFASAFTLPGGYRSGSSKAGTPLLAGTYAFRAFILADTLAFICSCLATFSLIFAGVPAMDIGIRLWYFEISALLLRISGRSLLVAFALGLYMVLAPVAHATAIAVCVIISITLLYGNSEVRQILSIINTARARLGTRLSVRRSCILMFFKVFIHVGLNFSSFLIIFGLPAIWN
ncbi:hypothetical protein ACP70R_050200 [Stipagrostis hirtigluma subsp. patula]